MAKCVDTERVKSWKNNATYHITPLGMESGASGRASQTLALIRMASRAHQIQTPGPTTRDAHSVGLEWSLRTHISNKLPGDAATADPKPHVQSQCHTAHFQGLSIRSVGQSVETF